MDLLRSKIKSILKCQMYALVPHFLALSVHGQHFPRCWVTFRELGLPLIQEVRPLEESGKPEARP